MQLKLTGPKRSALTCILTNLKALTSRVTCYSDGDGLRIQGLDTSHICMFDAYLPAGWFDEYSSDGDQVMTAPSGILAKIMAICTGDQSVALEVGPDAAQMEVSFTGDSAVCDKEFEVPLLEDHAELISVPELESDVDMSLPAKDFHELVGQLGIFSDTFQVRFDSESVEFKAVGDDGTMTAKLEEYEYAIAEDTVVKQSFALRYVQTMCSFWKLASTASLEFGDGAKPMTLTYTLGEDAHLRFHLAPKIADDD